MGASKNSGLHHVIHGLEVIAADKPAAKHGLKAIAAEKRRNEAKLHLQNIGPSNGKLEPKCNTEVWNYF